MELINFPLFIQIKDGEPFEHPILYDNFIAAFPEIDINNLPKDRFAKFIRVAHPTLGVYEVYVGLTYQWVDGVVKDVHEIRAMTDEEKAAKQKDVKDRWANISQPENWSTWTFDETTCAYVPPIPRPEPVENKIVFWCGAENNWKEIPPRPDDGKLYKFDFFVWNWIEESQPLSTKS